MVNSRRRKIFLRVLVLLVVVAIVVAGVAVWLFRSDPSWYRRVQLTEAQQAAGQQRLLDRVATLRNEVGRTQASVPATTQRAWPPFEIEMSEDEVNGVLMRWAETEPHLRETLRRIDEPHVRFLSDRIEFAGRYNGSIVSLELSILQTEDGPLVRLGRPWAGRLPLSRGLIEKPGEAAVESLRRDAGDAVPREMIDRLADLIAGEKVAPLVPLPSSFESDGVLSARVETLSVEDGVLKATLRPVSETLAQR